MKYLFTICFLSLTILSQSQPPLELIEIASGFNNPVDITNAGDDRLFVVEQRGTIKIIEADGSVSSNLFLDIDSRVRSGGERGLLGLAFHPNYTSNGYFYVNYTNNSGNTVIARFTSSGNTTDSDTEKILLTQDQPFSNHNGGDLTFGPDGYLYIGLGDGGAGGDPQNNAQDRLTFLGKMLRIDVDSGDPYSIPEDNPFAFEDSTLDEIWTLGWRNPWRFSFDRLTGDMWIADVGQDSWEEIDIEPANSAGGQNYGWRCYEGNEAFNTSSNCPAASELVFPIHQYPKPNNGCISVTGGFVYRGNDYPALQGHYIYADFCTEQFWSITPDGNGGWSNREFTIASNNAFGPSTFGEAVNGELYAADLSSGTIFQVTAACPNRDLGGQIIDETCGGDMDGAIDLILTGDIDSPTFTWSNGATTEDISNLEMGVYTVTVTPADGCTIIQEFVVNNNEYEVAIEIVEDENGVLSTVEGEAAYQWYQDGMPITGATNATYIPVETGDYNVQVTNQAGCSTFSNTLNIVILSTNEIQTLTGFTIAPNPFTNQLRLEINTTERVALQIRLTDLTGKVVYERKKTVRGEWSKNLSLPDLAAGVYFLSMEQEGKKAVKQVIKQ